MNVIGRFIRFLALVIVVILVLTHLGTHNSEAQMLGYVACILLFFMIIILLCFDTCIVILTNISSSVCGNNIDSNSASSYRTQVTDTVVSITRNGQVVLQMPSVTATASTEQNRTVVQPSAPIAEINQEPSEGPPTYEQCIKE